MNLTDKKGLSNHLNLSVGKIDKLMKNIQINYYKIGKNVRFNLNEVNDWVKNHKKENI